MGVCKLRTDLCDFSSFDTGSLRERIQTCVDVLRKTVDVFLRDQPTGFAKAWLPLEDATVALGSVWADASHMAAVRDSSDLREQIAACQLLLIEAQNMIGQNEKLYEVMSLLPKALLSVVDRAALERFLLDLEHGGIHLPSEAKQRLTELRIEGARLSQEFSSAVLDASQAWSLSIEDQTRLEGIPQNDRAMLAHFARMSGETGWRVNLQPASVAAVMTYAHDRDLRRRVYEASATLASDTGPTAGRFDNGPRIKRIMELRWEAARIHGFDSPATWLMARRMAQSPNEVREFLHALADQAKPVALEQLAQIRAFASKQLNIESLEPWDIGYVAERLKSEVLNLSDSEVRAYFPVDAVLSGWEWLLQSLFGINLARRLDVPVWHESVSYYDVLDENGHVFAGVYLDLHARNGKRNGAWMSQARPKRDKLNNSIPVAFLTCNFPAPDEHNVSLLSHGQVMTLLHETGHCLNLLFTQVNRPLVGGISGIEWDAIEIPSQMMEDFAWDHRVLQNMSRHTQTGAPLSYELFQRMLNARHFGRGIGLLRQIEMALFDLDLHETPTTVDVMAVLQNSRRHTAILDIPDWVRSPHSFQHIFAGAYASGYYSYLWAEWFSADGFALFAEHGVVSRACGERLRSELLSRGSVRPASENYKAFRGRTPRTDALLARHGLYKTALQVQPQINDSVD